MRQGTVVIGGGIGGLATAVLLARSGERVALVERTKALGGRGQTDAAGEFRLNRGPHALYRGGPAWDLLTELGVPLEGGQPAAAGWFDLGGTLHRMPAGPSSLWSTTLLDTRARIELAAWFARMLAGPAVEDVTIAAFLDGVRSPEVRLSLEAFFRVSTYGNDPEAAGVRVAIRQLSRASRNGVLYLSGGWQTIVDALAEEAWNSSVEILVGRTAEAIEPGSVRLDDGTDLAASAVVVALPGAAARRLLGERAPIDPWADHPVRLATLDVALSSLPDPARTLALGLDRPYYFSVHSKWARFGPPEGAVLHVAEYLSPSARGDRGALERWLDTLQPGWRECLVDSRFFPSLVVQSSTIGVGGGRPEADALRSEGIWLVGDWVGNEYFLLDGVLDSARRAATSLVGARARAA